MNAPTLADRVRIVEQKVGSLADLPARVASVELQISQFREEVRAEFSATRSEMGECESRLRAAIREGAEQLRSEMRDCEGRLRAEMRDGAEQLRAEMRSLNQETLSHMRVLHEDVIARIAVLGESANGRQRRKRRPKP
jgi:hypothetical protein